MNLDGLCPRQHYAQCVVHNPEAVTRVTHQEKEPREFVNKIASYLRCDCDECRGAIEKHTQSLLDTQREEIVKEVETLKYPPYKNDYWNEDMDKAIDTVIEKIKNK